MTSYRNGVTWKMEAIRFASTSACPVRADSARTVFTAGRTAHGAACVGKANTNVVPMRSRGGLGTAMVPIRLGNWSVGRGHAGCRSRVGDLVSDEVVRRTMERVGRGHRQSEPGRSRRFVAVRARAIWTCAEADTNRAMPLYASSTGQRLGEKPTSSDLATRSTASNLIRSTPHRSLPAGGALFVFADPLSRWWSGDQRAARNVKEQLHGSYDSLPPAICGTDTEEARNVVESSAAAHWTCPSRRSDEMVELVGGHCDFQQLDDEHPHRWLLIQAQQLVTDPLEPARQFTPCSAARDRFFLLAGPWM